MFNLLFYILRTSSPIEQELLSWYDEQGNRYLNAEEIAQQERQRAEQERQRAEKLEQYLRSLGVDPDNLPSDV